VPPSGTRHTTHQRNTLPDAVPCSQSDAHRGRPELTTAYDRRVTILIDDPRWPAHGRLWSHLISDSDLAELHEFAERNDIPRRGFDRDHYDVPAEAHDRLVAAGARPVDGHTLVRALIASGLRVTARERRRGA
jgi:hypothetical protein